MMALYTPGNEPENIKKRINTLFPKLDEAYPDKIICGLAKNHKKWAETVSELYRLLGYPDGNSFLEAYGYSVVKGQSGRTKSVNPDELINELKRRHPNGVASMVVFKEEDVDLAGSIKTVQNQSNELFGMSLAAYFKTIGLISAEAIAEAKKEKDKQKQDRMARLVQLIVVEDETNNKQIECIAKESDKYRVGSFVEINIEGKLIFCKVECISHVDIDDIPLLHGEIIRNVELSEYRTQIKGHGFTLSKDGTVVTKYTSEYNSNPHIAKVPQGVLKIQELGTCTFDVLMLNKELEEIEESVIYALHISGKRILVDEANEKYFTDEQALYEVLEDGTYRLLTYQYAGDGRAIILEGTSEIWKNAFDVRFGFKKIDLPSSLRIIHEKAFCVCSLENVIIPQNVKKIDSQAFSGCQKLATVKLPDGIDEVASDIFYNKRSETRLVSEKYLISNGLVKKKIATEKQTELGESTKANNPNKPKFDSMVDALHKLSFQKKADILENFSSSDEKVIVTIPAKQPSRGRSGLHTDLEKERLAALETVSNDEEIQMKIFPSQYLSEYCWEALTKDGRSLGELVSKALDEVFPVVKYIEVERAVLKNVVPLSKKKKGIKNGTFSVELTIKLKTLDSNVRKEDFIYIEKPDGIHIEAWENNSSKHTIDRLVIPSEIHGKKVVELSTSMFDNSTKTFNILEISEGIEEVNCNFWGLRIKQRVILPKSLKRFTKYFIYSDIEDFLERNNMFFEVEEGSFAEQYLRDYQPVYSWIKKPRIILKGQTITPEEIEMHKNFNFVEQNGTVAAFFSQPSENALSDLRVPCDYNGMPVTTMFIEGYYEASNGERLEESEFPNYLKSLSIPAKIRNIVGYEEEYLFYQNKNMSGIMVDDENESYWADGLALFTKDRRKLLRFFACNEEEYAVPDGTEEISKNAFCFMEKLKRVSLPKSLNKICAGAFTHCESLECIEGLENVKIMEELAVDLKILSRMKSDETVVGGVLLNYKAKGEKNYTVQDGVLEIGRRAFSSSENECLEEIILPNSIIRIGEGAFLGCKNLISLIMQQGIQSIGETAFAGCDSLKYIEIPEGVMLLPDGAFNCDNLETISLPSTIDTISEYAFPHNQGLANYSQEKYYSLREVNISNDNSNFKSVNGVVYSKDGKKLVYVPCAYNSDAFVIPEGVEEICERAMYGIIGVKEVIFPSTLKSFGKYALAESGIEKIVFPESVEEIGYGSFLGCSSLTNVTFSEKLSKIGEAAFWRCYNLKTIVLPDSLIEVGENAFEESGIEEIIWGTGIKSIRDRAFAQSKLKRVVLPKSVAEIGTEIFGGCPEIEIYDCIDSNGKNCYSQIDTTYGDPNSNVGTIGMKRFVIWKGIANHHWSDYTLTVKSAETDEIKYQVWMGANEVQMDYCCFLASAWGQKATFAFKELDKRFRKIDGKKHKIKVAEYRLKYPIELSDEMRSMYEKFLETNM